MLVCTLTAPSSPPSPPPAPPATPCRRSKAQEKTVSGDAGAETGALLLPAVGALLGPVPVSVGRGGKWQERLVRVRVTQSISPV